MDQLKSVAKSTKSVHDTLSSYPTAMRVVIDRDLPPATVIVMDCDSKPWVMTDKWSTITEDYDRQFLVDCGIRYERTGPVPEVIEMPTEEVSELIRELGQKSNKTRSISSLMRAFGRHFQPVADPVPAQGQLFPTSIPDPTGSD